MAKIEDTPSLESVFSRQGQRSAQGQSQGTAHSQEDEQKHDAKHQQSKDRDDDLKDDDRRAEEASQKGIDLEVTGGQGDGHEGDQGQLASQGDVDVDSASVHDKELDKEKRKPASGARSDVSRLTHQVTEDYWTKSSRRDRSPYRRGWA
jgi:hypothetical protein